MNDLARIDHTALAEQAGDLKTLMQNAGLSWHGGELTLTGAAPRSIEPLKTSLMQLSKCLGPEKFYNLLEELWLKTKKPAAIAETPFSKLAEIYEKDLIQYPGPIVARAITEWTHTPKPRNAHHWFPGAPELVDDVRAASDEFFSLRRAVEGFNLDEARERRRYKLRRDLHNLEAGDPHWEDRNAPSEVREAGRLRRISEIKIELEAMEG